MTTEQNGQHQEEQMAKKMTSQMKSFLKNGISEPTATKDIKETVASSKENSKEFVDGARQLASGATKTAVNIAQAPGTIVEKSTNAVGSVMNAPGALVQGVSNGAGKVLEKTGDFLGDGVGKLLGEDVGNMVKGLGKASSGLVKFAGGLAGGVLKAPGNLLKMTGNLAGKILKTPGEILKGIADGAEKIVFNQDQFKGREPKLKPINTPEQLLQEVKDGGGKGLIDGARLHNMDKFAEKVAELAGREGTKNPFSRILDLPKSERAVAVDKAVKELRDDLTKVVELSKQGPLNDYAKINNPDVKRMVAGIEARGGVDKFMDDKFGYEPSKTPQEKDQRLTKDELKKDLEELAKGTPKDNPALKEIIPPQNSKEENSKEAKDGKEEKPLTPQEQAKKDLNNVIKKSQDKADKAAEGFKKTYDNLQKNGKEKDVSPVISGNVGLSTPNAPSKGLGR